MPDLRWFDRAVDQLEQELSDELCTQAEFSKAMADLRRELREQHQDEREEAMRNVDREWGDY